MKTFRDYLNDCRFEDVWSSIVENFSEPEGIKPVYTEYWQGDKNKSLSSASDAFASNIF